MINPKISVVMCVYNASKYLDDSINSILKQTLEEFEFIIINDYSIDNSLEIINKYQKRDKRIKVINNKKNIGAAGSRNKGIKIAKGKYIAILDSDDISLRDRLKVQYDFLENNKNTFLVGSGAFIVDENMKVLRNFNPITNEEKLKKALEIKNCIYTSTIMFRNKKDVLYRPKLNYSEDYDFYLNLLSKERRLINLPDKLVKYRISSNSISFSKRAKQKLLAEKAKEFYFQRLKNGYDKYDDFDRNDISDIDIESSTDKRILESEIKSNFELSDFKRTRKILFKYFKHYGIINKFLFYYLFTLLGKDIVNVLRKKLKY